MPESLFVTALLLTLVAAAPVDGRFVLEVAGLPVAELRVAVKGDRFIYESTHFLEEGPREHRIELPLSPVPEVLSLLRRPSPGCRDVLEERKQVLEKLCVERATPGEVTGTLAGEAFTAHYDESGALRDITVGSARWVGASKPTAPPRESPFVRGLEVATGPLALAPEFPGARWLNHPPIGIGKPEHVGRVRCLVLAREEVRHRPKARIAVGVVIEERRAYPHAWLVEDGTALEPSVLPGDPVLAQRRYLEVPTERSGAFFLQLFDGAVRLKAQ